MNRGNRVIFSSLINWPRVFAPKRNALTQFKLLFLCLAISSLPAAAEVSFKDFGLTLYAETAPKDKNFAMGPGSVGQSLALAGVGARGETEAQFSKLFGFRPASKAGELRKLGSQLQSEQVTVRSANRAWLDARLKLLPEYQKVLGDSVAPADFRQSKKARKMINAWVAESTAGQIEELLPSGSLNTLTRLVLTNAIYFKGGWLTPFDKGKTQDLPFQTPAGEKNVPTMQLVGTFPYSEVDGHQLVVLPFNGRRWGMVIILPPRERGWKPSTHRDVFSDWFEPTESQVALSLPRFKVRGTTPLKKRLSNMGLALAFSKQSDFSGIDGSKNLVIDEVYHEATVAVDEEGAEASAATAVVARTRGGAPERVEMKVDRPFGFAIIDLESPRLEPLFLGQVTDPL